MPARASGVAFCSHSRNLLTAVVSPPLLFTTWTMRSRATNCMPLDAPLTCFQLPKRSVRLCAGAAGASGSASLASHP